MKLTAVLLTVLSLQVSASAFSQKLTMKLKRVSLEKVFKEIRKQTGYTFFYESGLARKTDVVSVEVTQANLEETLNKSLAGTNLKFDIVDKTIIISPKEKTEQVIASKQMTEIPPPPPMADIRITGKVLSDDNGGQPLNGAAVRIKGGIRGVTTDNNGLFVIMVPDKGGELEISYIGYETQTIKVGKTSGDLLVKLKPKDARAEEVVVVAFGTQKKVSVLGAINSVSTKDMLQTPAANITNTLAGRLPGLIALQQTGDPGRDAANLLIRGKSTLNTNAPLVLVDGVERDFTSIDPNEVETISILKDASATAVFGIRGANGVILVTTRRGVSAKPVVSFTSNTSIQKVTAYPQFVNSYQYAVLKNEGYTNEGKPAFYDSTMLKGYRDHLDPYLYPDLDYAATFLKNASLMQQFNLNVSGGNNFVKYFVSGSYLNQGGLFKIYDTRTFDESVNYTRYNFRSNLDFDLSSKTRLTVNLGVRNELRKGPYTDQISADASTRIFSAIVRIPPNAMPFLNPDGTYAVPTSSRVDPDAGGIAGMNVLAELSQAGVKNQYSNTIDASIILTQKLDMIVKGLSWTVNGSMTNGYTQTTGRFRPIIGGGAINNFYARYAVLGKNPDGTYQYSGPGSSANQPLISYTETNALNSKRWYFETKLNYAGRTGKHNYTALTLMNASRYMLPGGIWPYSYLGISGRVTYDYDSRYFAEVNLGYNGSENFAKDKRMGFFPAYSLGWVISNESFMKTVKWVSLLKLRGTYGKVGNDQGVGRFLFFDNPYANTGSYSFGLTNGNTVSGYSEGVQGNRNISWEVATKYNGGAEAKFFGRLLGISADVFYEKRTGILINYATVPSVYGQSIPAANLGIVENRGFEIELNHENHIGKANYWVRANVGFARNKIIYRDEPTPLYPNLARTGRSIDQSWGLKTDGFFRDQAEIDAWYAKGYTTIFPTKTLSGKLVPGDFKYVDVNGDKVIDNNDMVPIGKPVYPEDNFSVSFGGNYKNFDFSAMFQGATSSSMFVSNEGGWAFFNAGKAFKEIWEQRWTPATAATAAYPRLSSSPASGDYNYVSNDFWSKDASYLRLKQMQIGYSFSSEVVRRLRVKTIRIYLSGTNLFTISKVKYLDPENRATNAIYYPQQKVFNFGVNVTF